MIPWIGCWPKSTGASKKEQLWFEVTRRSSIWRGEAKGSQDRDQRASLMPRRRSWRTGLQKCSTHVLWIPLGQMLLRLSSCRSRLDWTAWWRIRRSWSRKMKRVLINSSRARSISRTIKSLKRMNTGIKLEVQVWVPAARGEILWARSRCMSTISKRVTCRIGRRPKSSNEWSTLGKLQNLLKSTWTCTSLRSQIST